MKNRKIQLVLAGFFLFSAGLPVLAQEKTGEEKRLEASASELDKKHHGDQERMAAGIKAEFGVDDGRIMGLRFRKMRDSEIAISLALAQEMHGGLTDKNLYEIVSLRQGPPVAGWGKIAGKFGLKLGPVEKKIKKISAEFRKRAKADRTKKEMADKAKAAEKTGKPEKSGQPERTENENMKALMRK